MAKCEDCKYWEGFPDDKGDFTQGECRRHSPPYIRAFEFLADNEPCSNGAEIYREAVWPATMPFDWCGEFEAKTVTVVYPSLEAINLPWRVRDILLNAGIDDAHKLVDCSARILMRLRGFGEASLWEVRRALRLHDLFLVGDEQFSREAEEKERKADAAVREALGIDGPNEDKK